MKKEVVGTTLEIEGELAMNKPEFHLSRVFGDGTREDLEVVGVSGLTLDLTSNRREFVGAGLTVSGVVALLAGCGPKKIKGAPPHNTSGPLRAHRTAISGITMAPDGRSVLTAGVDDTIKVWSYPGGEYRAPINTEQSHKNGFQAFLVTADGQRLVTETHDLLSNDIEIRSFPGGGDLHKITDLKKPIQSLAATPDSQILISGDSDGTIQLFANQKHLATLEGHTGAIFGLQVSQDGENLYSASAEAVRVWSIPQRRFLRKLDYSGAPISSVHLSRDSRYLAVGASDGSSQVFSTSSGAVVSKTQFHSGPVHSIQISRTSDRVFSGSSDQTVKVWSLRDGKLIATISQALGEVKRILLSVDEFILFIGTSLGVVALWDLVAGKIRSFLFDPSISDSTVRGTTYSVYDAQFNRTTNFTLPCGSAIPAEAICICNCVEGKQPPPRAAAPPPISQPPPPYRPPSCSCVSQCSCNAVSQCTCDKVCTCNLVCSCLAVP